MKYRLATCPVLRSDPLEELLTAVAGFAVRAIPGADGAGLTLLEDDRANTIVATAALAVLLVLGYAFGWFRDGAEAPAPTTTAPAPAPGAGGTTL